MNPTFIKYSFYALYTYAGAHVCHDLYKVGGKVLAKVRASKAENEARHEAMTPGDRIADDVAKIADDVRAQTV